MSSTARTPRSWIAANRLPVVWSPGTGWTRGPGGLVTALDAVVRRRRLGWIGCDERGDDAGSRPTWVHGPLVAVPVASEVRTAAVDGVCNGALWPALHGMTGEVVWRDAHWPSYVEHNRHFADSLLGCTAPGDVVWLHDYHLLLVPELLAGHGRTVAISLHTPVDAAGVGSIPVADALLASLRTADVIGVQTAADAAAMELLSSGDAPAPDGATPGRSGRSHPEVVVSPVGIDPDALRTTLADAPAASMRRRVVDANRGRRMIVGIDRLDYTKGIVERLHGVDIAFRRGWLDPETVDIVNIVQPSRVDVPAYRRLRLEVERLAHDVSARWLRRDGSSPVEVRVESADRREVAALLGAADVCLVTSLRDGMNLLAKEFSAVGRDDAVLVLSAGAGAHAELGASSVTIDGRDPHSIAAGLRAALQTDEGTRRRWSRERRDAVDRWTAADWATAFLDRCGEVAAADQASSKVQTTRTVSASSANANESDSSRAM